MSEVKTTKKVTISHLFGRINDEDANAGITCCLGAGITFSSRHGLSIHARKNPLEYTTLSPTV